METLKNKRHGNTEQDELRNTHSTTQHGIDADTGDFQTLMTHYSAVATPPL